LIDHYDWSGGCEAMLRFGPADGPVVIAALPLLEEANRTRTFVMTILRELVAQGLACALPDLPATGESLIPTEQLRLADLQEAYAAAARQAGARTYALGVRSGALIDATAPVAGRWHLAPTDGADLLRELHRIRKAGGSEDFGGNRLSVELLTELEHAVALEARVVRLEADARPAQKKLAGSPLWRRAEPDNDPALARLLAADVVEWVRACEG
jgi:hypothetical protein